MDGQTRALERYGAKLTDMPQMCLYLFFIVINYLMTCSSLLGKLFIDQVDQTNKWEIKCDDYWNNL